jgi:hypothetical protein
MLTFDDLFTMQVSGALTLSGSDYLRVSTSLVPSTYTKGITFSFWCKYTGSASASWPRIFDFANGPGQDNILIAKVPNADSMVFRIWQGNTLSSDITVNNILPAGNKSSHQMFPAIVFVFTRQKKIMQI